MNTTESTALPADVAYASKPTDRRRARSGRRWFVGMTVFYWLLLFTLTHIPGPNLPEVEVSDKTIHFVAYALLAGMVLSSLHLLRPSSRINEPLTLLIVLAYGAFDETTQPYFNRSGEVADWLADAAGVALAVGVVGLFWAWIKRPRTPM